MQFGLSSTVYGAGVWLNSKPGNRWIAFSMLAHGISTSGLLRWGSREVDLTGLLLRNGGMACGERILGCLFV
jgi:hypothetical protein